MLWFTNRPFLAQLPGSSETAASFEFLDEGHTLGNALRYIIMKKYGWIAGLHSSGKADHIS